MRSDGKTMGEIDKVGEIALFVTLLGKRQKI